MPYPDRPTRAYSYTGFQQGQGDNTFPGTQLDADLDALFEAVGEVGGFLPAALDADGRLKAGSVGRRQLAADVQLGLASPRPWAAATTYEIDDTVTNANGLYAALADHTSTGAFAADLAAGKWALLATWAPLTTVSDGAVTEPKLANDAVSRRTLAAGAVGADEVENGSLPPAKMTSAAGFTPVGALSAFAGVTLPSGWIWADGKTYSRTVYAALFSALTAADTVSMTLNSPVLTGLAVDWRGLGLEGAVLEGPGVPAGTTVLSVGAATITMSQNAVSTGANRQVRMFPHGNGDGVNTFTVPDGRGVVLAGRDALGGAAAGRLSVARLGGLAGSETTALTTAQMPAHNHTAVSGPHSHTGAVASHAHSGAFTVTSGTVAAGGVPITLISGTTDTGAAAPGVTIGDTAVAVSIGSTGDGAAHSNLQPTAVVNTIIFAGV